MTIINIASKKSIYIIPGSKSYTLMPEIYTPVDMDLLDSTGLDSIQRDLGVLIVSDNNTALRQYLSKKTLQGAVSAESIQDLMAATLINSVYDDEANTILVGGSGGLTETQVNSLIEDALLDFTPSGGGGFSFGGDWDATSQQVVQVASFDVLDNCTITDGVFSPNSPIGAALATHISKPTNTIQRMTFVWPYTDSTSILMVGLCTPSSNTDIEAIFNGTNTGFVCIGYFNAAVKMSKYGNNAPEMIPTDNPVAMGDVVQLEYFADTNIVSFSNLTDNTSLGHFALGNYAEFSSSLSLFIYSKGVVSFDIDTNLTPFTQTFYSLTLPENPDGKTYIVINADTNSILNGRLLKDGDFVDFITNEDDEVVDVVVSRLVSDSNIRDTISTTLNDPNSSLSNLVINLGGEAGLDYVEAALNEARNDNPSDLTTSLDDFLAYLLVNNASSFYETFQTQVQAAISNEIQSGGIIDTAIQAAINP